MKELMRHSPLTVWFLFLAGAITGSMSSTLLEPGVVVAGSGDLNGRKFQELQQCVQKLEQDVASHKHILEPFSRDEFGLRITDPVEINTESNPVGMLLPALATVNSGGAAIEARGSSLFTDTGRSSPVMAILPIEHQGPALAVDGWMRADGLTSVELLVDDADIDYLTTNTSVTRGTSYAVDFSPLLPSDPPDIYRP